MVLRRTPLSLALVACLAIGLPAGAAQAKAGDPPLAQAAGDGPPPLSPAIVGVPLARADAALDQAADAIDAGNGAGAVAPLTSARRHMIRAQNGAKYLVATMPAAPPAEDRSLQRKQERKFVRLARETIRDRREGDRRGWLTARAAGDPVGPALADTPTAVFGVFTSQYDVATTAAGLMADVQGELLTRVEKTLDTAIILRNRLVQIVHAAAPPVPPEDRRARMAQDADDVTTFDTVMPGLTVLLGDEIQQFTALGQDPTVPAASSAALTDALAADQQILTMVNTWWPPVVED